MSRALVANAWTSYRRHKHGLEKFPHTHFIMPQLHAPSIILVEKQWALDQGIAEMLFSLGLVGMSLFVVLR